MEDDGIYECKAIILNGISITRIRLAVLSEFQMHAVIYSNFWIAGPIKFERVYTDIS